MRALFLGAHPDDVEVSAGGTVRTLVAEDWEVDIHTWSNYMSDERIEEGQVAASVFGAHYSWTHGVWTFSEMVAKLGRIYPDLDLIVTPPSTDSHQDHRKVAELGLSLARKNNIKLWEMNHAIPGGIYGMPALNHFVTFGPTVQAIKEQAIRKHASQIEKYGGWWLEAIYTRDRYLGIMVDRIDVTYAEGFHIVIG